MTQLYLTDKTINDEKDNENGNKGKSIDVLLFFADIIFFNHGMQDVGTTIQWWQNNENRRREPGAGFNHSRKIMFRLN